MDFKAIVQHKSYNSEASALSLNFDLCNERVYLLLENEGTPWATPVWASLLLILTLLIIFFMAAGFKETAEGCWWGYFESVT